MKQNKTPASRVAHAFEVNVPRTCHGVSDSSFDPSGSQLLFLHVGFKCVFPLLLRALTSGTS